MATDVVTKCRHCQAPLTWQPATGGGGLFDTGWWSDETAQAGRALCGRGESTPYRGHPHDQYHRPVLPDLTSPSQIEVWLAW